MQLVDVELEDDTQFTQSSSSEDLEIVNERDIDVRGWRFSEGVSIYANKSQKGRKENVF